MFLLEFDLLDFFPIPLKETIWQLRNFFLIAFKNLADAYKTLRLPQKLLFKKFLTEQTLMDALLFHDVQ